MFHFGASIFILATIWIHHNHSYLNYMSEMADQIDKFVVDGSKMILIICLYYFRVPIDFEEGRGNILGGSSSSANKN